MYNYTVDLPPPPPPQTPPKQVHVFSERSVSIKITFYVMNCQSFHTRATRKTFRVKHVHVHLHILVIYVRKWKVDMARNVLNSSLITHVEKQRQANLGRAQRTGIDTITLQRITFKKYKNTVAELGIH